MHVVIIGAGIGGLMLALSLHQVGIAARVHESVEALAPVGVGINLLPHAVRELCELGLQERLAAVAIPAAALGYHSRHGRLIWLEARGREARGVARGIGGWRGSMWGSRMGGRRLLRRDGEAVLF